MSRPVWTDLLERPDVKRLRDVLGERDDVMLVLLTQQGELRWASAAGSADLFGHGPAASTGRDALDHVHRWDRHLVAWALDETVSTGETQRITYRTRAADGSWRHVTTVTWPVRTGDEELVVALSVPARNRAPEPAGEWGPTIVPPGRWGLADRADTI